MKRNVVLLAALLISVGISGCVGGPIKPAYIPDDKLATGWKKESSGGVTVGTIFSAYMNIYAHEYRDGGWSINDGVIVLAKMSDVAFVDEVGLLNSLIEDNLEDVRTELENRFNCTINIEKSIDKNRTIDGYNVIVYEYSLSGSSNQGSVSGNVLRAAWKCKDKSAVAVLGVSLSAYQEEGKREVTPDPNQWENVQKMISFIESGD